MLSVMMSRMNPSSCLGSSSGDFLRLAVVDDDEVRDDGVPPSSMIDKKSSLRTTATTDGSSSSIADVVEAASACSIIDCSLLFGQDNELYLQKIDELWDNTFIYNHPVDDNDDTCDYHVAENNDDEMERIVLQHLHQVVPTLLSRISAKYPPPSSSIPRRNSTDLAKCADPATAIIRQKEQNVCDVYGSEALQELHDLTITTTATATTTNNRKNGRGGKKGALINYYRLLMIHRSDVCGGNIVEILTRVLVGRSSSSSIGNRHSTKKNENYSSNGDGGGGEDEESFDYSLDDTLFGGGNKGSPSAQHRQRTASGGKYGPSTLAANEDRRLACWTLCNLAMPHENKLAMLQLPPPSPFLSLPSIVVSSSTNDEQRGITSRIKVGEEGEQKQDQHQQLLLLQALTCVIGRNLPESYLCFICLLNLTYCTENSRIVVYYIPPTTARSRRKLNTDDDDNDKSQQKHYLPSSQMCGSRIRSQSEPIIVSRIGSDSSNNYDKKTKMYKPSMMSRRGISLNILDTVGNGSVVSSQSRVGILSSIIDNNQLSTMDQLVLCNPSSLLRIIERSMNTNYSYAFGSVQSVQGEAIRWACGLIRNLTRTSPTVVQGGGGGGGGGEKIGNDVEVTTTTNDKVDSISSRRIDWKRHGNDVTNKDEKCLLLSSSNNAAEEVCKLLSQTTIPKILIQLISTSPRSSIEWTCNSLEDACLGTMCNMAIWPCGLKALRLAGVTESKCLRELERVPGIHGYRAKALRRSLGALSR